MSVSQVMAIAAVLTTWGLMAVVVAGLGAAIHRLVVGDEPQVDPWDAWWLGICGAIAGLQLWHLFLPIDWRATAVLVAVGGVSAGRWLWAWRAHGPSRLSIDRRLVIVMAGFIVWMANRATGPGEFTDSGCYHIAGIRWANEHAIVPGLANLLDNLGLNNAVFLLNAACESGFWHGRSNHLVNALLLAMLGLQTILCLWRCWRAGPPPSPVDLFTAVQFPLVIASAVGREVSSPTTDMSAGLIATIGLNALVRLATERAASSSRMVAVGILVAACASAAVCLKVSMAVTGAGTIVCLYWLLRTRGLGWPVGMAIAALPGAALVVPWAVRGVVLSGYPLFPSTAVPFPFEWRLPAERMISIRGFAANSGLLWWMSPEEIPAERIAMTVGWFLQWTMKCASREPLTVFVPAVASLLLAGWLIVARGRRFGGERHAIARWLPTVLPVLAGLVFWFVNCPAPRMGCWILWAMAGWLAAVAGQAGLLATDGRRRAFVLCLVGLSLLAVVHRTIWWVDYHRSTGRAAVIDPFTRSLWMPPGTDHGLHPYPTTDLLQRTNRWGLTVTMPVHGSPTWWAPLPATYNDITDLRLRRAGDLAHGFVTDTGPAPPATGDQTDQEPLGDSVTP
jgi:hypothetical protein